MRNKTCRRQSLHFSEMHDVVSHVQQLADTGYRQLGNWSLGQACNHLAQTVEMSVDGFPSGLPAPVAAVQRWLFFHLPAVPRLLGRIRVPTTPELAQNDPVEDASGIERLERAVERYSQPDVVLQPNPVLGPLTVEQWHQFHVWHAARHLSFLQPQTAESAAADRSCCKLAGATGVSGG